MRSGGCVDLTWNYPYPGHIRVLRDDDLNLLVGRHRVDAADVSILHNIKINKSDFNIESIPLDRDREKEIFDLLLNSLLVSVLRLFCVLLKCSISQLC